MRPFNPATAAAPCADGNKQLSSARDVAGRPGDHRPARALRMRPGGRNLRGSPPRHRGHVGAGLGRGPLPAGLERVLPRRCRGGRTGAFVR